MYSVNNSWKYDKRSLYSSNDNYKLPSFEWQKKTELVNEFNNNLVSGFKSNLTLYSPEKDLKLFNNLDLEPIRSDNVNFDKVNAITQENYNKNDDIYHNARSYVAGVVDQVNKSTNDLFNIDTSSLKIYFGLFLAFMFLNRK